MKDLIKQAVIQKAKQLKQTGDSTSVCKLIQELCKQYEINYQEVEHEI